MLFVSYHCVEIFAFVICLLLHSFSMHMCMCKKFAEFLNVWNSDRQGFHASRKVLDFFLKILGHGKS